MLSYCVNSLPHICNRTDVKTLHLDPHCVSCDSQYNKRLLTLNYINLLVFVMETWCEISGSRGGNMKVTALCMWRHVITDGYKFLLIYFAVLITWQTDTRNAVRRWEANINLELKEMSLWTNWGFTELRFIFWVLRLFYSVLHLQDEMKLPRFFLIRKQYGVDSDHITRCREGVSEGGAVHPR
jgi:hypothetical protein